MTVLALNGSPSASSKTRALAQLALDAAGGGRLVDLSVLDAEALLGRRDDPEIADVLVAVAGADLLVVATPIYRATYTALTKTVFDLLDQDALRGTVVVPIATGAGSSHRLAVDHGLRPLVASLAGWTTPTGVYATRDDFTDDGRPGPAIAALVRQAVDEALAVVRARVPDRQ